MDPLTQGLLGASVGEASYGRLLGRRAVVWGALVGMAPDLDVLASRLRPAGDWLWHRGPTHALLFGPLVGPAIGWLLWKRLGGRLGHWIGLCVAALFTIPSSTSSPATARSSCGPSLDSGSPSTRSRSSTRPTA